MKKNLLIITLHADPSMPPGVGEWGGTHTYMRELLTELCEETYNIVLITRKVYPEAADLETISPNCRILRLTLGDFGLFDKRTLFALHEQTLLMTVQKLNSIGFKPDIIHSVYWNSGHLAVKLSEMWNIPYVHSVISNGRGRNLHGASGTASNRIETEETVFQHASFILCVAQSEKAEICQYYSIKSEKVIVAGQYVHPAFLYPAHNSFGMPRRSGVHYKIETQYYPSLLKSDSLSADWWNKKVFTYTGRLGKDKGIPIIVQAWYRLLKKYKNECPPLWIIGGSAVDIENIRPQLGIPENILALLEKNNCLVWWGYLDENGISAVYSKTLALVTHSLYEPGGRVAVEAMCSGLPVIATPNGFALDAVRDWHNGFLVNYQDLNTLEKRLEHFCKQPYLSNMMGQQAIKIGNAILKNWNFKHTHIEVYNAALNHQKYTKLQAAFPLDEPVRRDVQTYPYNQILLDTEDILRIMKDNGFTEIKSIKEIQIPSSSSYFWSVMTSQGEYYVKIPYDRINLFPLWAPKNEQPLVITSLKRYEAQIGANLFSELPPIAGKDNKHRAIIYKKYSAAEMPQQEQYRKAVEKLCNFYQNAAENGKELENSLNTALQGKAGYQDADRIYSQISKAYFPWQNYFMDYSLRVELMRWKAYYDALSSSQKDSIKDIWDSGFSLAVEASQAETSLRMILNHGGSDIKNLVFTPEPILLDNEKIHTGWPGIDFSDLAITYIRRICKHETPEIWRDILSQVPASVIPARLLIGWILLGTFKEAISETAQLKAVDSRLLDRVKILSELSVSG